MDDETYDQAIRDWCASQDYTDPHIPDPDVSEQQSDPETPTELQPETSAEESARDVEVHSEGVSPAENSSDEEGQEIACDDSTAELLEELSDQLIQGDLLRQIELNQADAARSCTGHRTSSNKSSSGMATESVREYLFATSGSPSVGEQPIIPSAQVLLFGNEALTAPESDVTEVEPGEK